MNATSHNQPALSDKPGKPAAMSLWKQFLALGLGLIALLVGAFLEDAMGTLAAVIGMGAYFLIVQFLLSWGKPFALLDDGASIVVLNTPVVCVLIVAGRWAVLLLAMVTVACSYAGAMLASIMAMWREDRRTARQRVAPHPSYPTDNVLTIHEHKDEPQKCIARP